MRKLVSTVFMSLDGVIREPGDWQGPFFEEEAARIARERLFASDALLIGRGTYEVFAGAWPGATDEGDGFVDRINSIPKYLVSTTMDSGTWNPTTVISKDVEAEVRKLKEQPGQDILIYGVGQLAHTMLRAGLVDVFEVWVHPVMLGDAKPDDLLLREGTMKSFTLTSTETTPAGIVVCVYEPKSDN